MNIKPGSRSASFALRNAALGLSAVVALMTVACGPSAPETSATGGRSAGAGGVTASGGSSVPVTTGGATGSGGGATGGISGGSGGAAMPGAGGSGTGGSVTGGSAGTGGAVATGGTAGAANSGGKGGSGSIATGGNNGGGAGGRGGATTASGGSTTGAATGADAGVTDGGVGGVGVDPGATTCTLSGVAGAKTPTIYVIGDSTASIYASSLYPRMGWAQPLQDFYAPACATIQDKALSGRSSKSFYDEGAFKPISSALKAGDYLLIQFSHNDEKSAEPTLFTDPQTTFKQYLSKYIDESQAKGAIPILLTPINRNNWNGTTLSDTHGAYPPAMRELAAARKIPLVDATALTKTYFERIGPAATAKLFLILAAGQFPNYPDGNTDNTHLQESGARTIAQLILSDMARQQLAPGRLTKVVPKAP